MRDGGARTTVLTSGVRRFQQVPDRDAGDSSMQAYTAHAGILRRLFSLPLKTKTKHQVRRATQH